VLVWGFAMKNKSAQPRVAVPLKPPHGNWMRRENCTSSSVRNTISAGNGSPAMRGFSGRAVFRLRGIFWPRDSPGGRGNFRGRREAFRILLRTLSGQASYRFRAEGIFGIHDPAGLPHLARTLQILRRPLRDIWTWKRPHRFPPPNLADGAQSGGDCALRGFGRGGGGADFSALTYRADVTEWREHCMPRQWASRWRR
jgi:hypothetical protein